MSTLHILNGDSTAFTFKKTKIEGDQLIWREILSDGPVAKTNLWELRSAWISENFNEQPDQYASKVLSEVDKLTQLSGFDEIILWFEFDLVCQINLIYILSELYRVGYRQPIYLICPEKIEGLPNFRGLGELNPEQLTNLLPTKVKLNAFELKLASQTWDLYLRNNPDEIADFLSQDFGNLPLLKKALKAHLLRFPNAKTKLNYIEETLLQLIKEGITLKPAIYEAFWTKEPIFGMGDHQLELVLSGLKEKGLIDGVIV